MFGELAIGITVSLIVMMIHLMATYLLLDSAEFYEHTLLHHPRLRLMIALLGANIVLLGAHLLEVSVWALVYDWKGLIAHSHDAFYSAFLNYTTLGFGDSLSATHTRLLGPLASASGILMFGWSTALMFLMLQRHLSAVSRWKSKGSPDEAD